MMGESFVIDETEADLEPGDIEELLRCRYVEPVDGKYVRGTVRVFWVAEMLKRRRRLVTHPRQQNDLPFQKEPDIFPKDSEIFDIENKEVAACIDMRAFFNQFELPSMLRNFFCFKAVGVWYHYRLCTIPTGGRESPIIAQIIVRSLALRLEDSCQVKPLAVDDGSLGNLASAGLREYAKMSQETSRCIHYIHRRIILWMGGGIVGQGCPENCKRSMDLTRSKKAPYQCARNVSSRARTKSVRLA